MLDGVEVVVVVVLCGEEGGGVICVFDRFGLTKVMSIN